ncbi:hypothetical protein KAI87_17005, partial [Myxococcota bacterium]|nr:hypothetical protein [Myxococcota bacterium]
MTKRRLKLRWLEHNNRLFHLLLLVTTGAALAAGGWFYSSSGAGGMGLMGSNTYENLLSRIPHWDRKTLSADPGPAWKALLAAAKKEELTAGLVVDAWIECEAGDWSVTPKKLRGILDNFAERAAQHSSVVEAESATARFGSFKRALLTGHPLVYNEESSSVGHVLLEGHLQCRSGSRTVALAWLSLVGKKEEYKRGRPLLIHTCGHLQPGLMEGGRIFVAEATVKEAKITALAQHEMKNMLVADALYEFALILLGAHAPAWIKEKVVIVDTRPAKSEIPWYLDREEKPFMSEAEKFKRNRDRSPFAFGWVYVPPGD